MSQFFSSLPSPYTEPYSIVRELRPVVRTSQSLSWTVGKSVTSSSDLTLETSYENVRVRVDTNQNVNANYFQTPHFFSNYTFRKSYPTFDYSKLDILVIVDNSASMEGEQAKLGSTYASLISQVGARDWRILVTTHESTSECVANVITPATPQPEAAFAAAVQKGNQGSNNETPFLKLMRLFRARNLDRTSGFGPTPPCAGLRSNVPVGAVILTNEDECSTGKSCSFIRNQVYPAGTYYSRSGLGITLAESDYSHHYRLAKIYWSPTSTSICPSALARGAQLNSMVNSYSYGPGWHKDYDICAADFSPATSDFSRTLRDMPQLYPLHENPTIPTGVAPVANTLSVKLDGVLLPPSAYDLVGPSTLVGGQRPYSRQFVKLVNNPGDGHTLEIAFQLPGDAVSQTIPLVSAKIAEGYTVANVQLFKADYVGIRGSDIPCEYMGLRTYRGSCLTAGTDYRVTIANGEGTLNLLRPVEPGDSLQIKLIAPVVRPRPVSELNVGENFVTDYPVTVTRNNVAFVPGNLRWSNTNGVYKLLFDELPADINYVFTYRNLNDPRLSYPASVPRTGEFVSAIDRDTQEVLPGSLSPDRTQFLFGRSVVRAGRRVRVAYQFQELVEGSEIELEATAIPEGIEIDRVELSDGSLAPTPSAVSVDGRRLRVIHPRPELVRNITAHYERLDFRQSQDLELPRFATDAILKRYQVFLNGEELAPDDPRVQVWDFVGTVTFHGYFRESDRVEIRYSAFLRPQ